MYFCSVYLPGLTMVFISFSQCSSAVAFNDPFLLALWYSPDDSILWQKFLSGFANQPCLTLSVTHLPSFFSTSGTQNYLCRILQPPFVCHLDLWRRWSWPFSFQDAALDGCCRRKEKNQEECKYQCGRWVGFISLGFFFFLSLFFWVGFCLVGLFFWVDSSQKLWQLW